MNTSNSSIYYRDEDGCETWQVNGVLHRKDGPAVIYPNGTMTWYMNGMRHREDGPAIERPSGDHEWFLYGRKVKPEKLPCDYEYLKLKYLL